MIAIAAQIKPSTPEALQALAADAIEIVVQTQTASVSLLQRRLRVGYTRAGRLIDMLERRGIISGYEGSKPRRVLVEEHKLYPAALAEVASGRVKLEGGAVIRS